LGVRFQQSLSKKRQAKQNLATSGGVFAGGPSVSVLRDDARSR
jgi:hypothetical protein